jgi:tetratricopeptide (TPR) repeat protein
VKRAFISHANAFIKRVRGTSIGRFLVLDPLGEGGMGVVYAAYDPELDRKVAIKLLHPRIGDSAELRARLVREAQAMARLTHPNVVSVYDVGTYRDDVFVAMELVDGQTLRKWMREQPRSWREVLSIFRQAGQGLAAAHAAGLVHRDFKPANVLVGKDRVAKVTDFGLALARSSDGTEARPPEDAATRSVSPPYSPGNAPTPQTSPGVGTPGYMAPEQLRGEPIDARADQYSFCVALYEALFGERPAEGRTLTAVSIAEPGPAAPQVFELARRSKVPAWVLRPILRGLSPDPSDRFESVDTLLAKLSAEPRGKVQRVAVAGMLVAFLATGAIAYRGTVQKHNLICKGAEAKLAGVWDSVKQGQIERAFLATAKPFASAAFAGIRSRLSAHARSWVSMHTEACEATRLRGEQSEAVLDLRMDCLRRRLDEMNALTDLFARADAQIVEKAVEAAHGMTPLQTCVDVAGLTARVRPPADPVARAEVDKLTSAFAQAQALRDTGKYLEALELAKRLAPDAQKIGYRPLEGEALYLLGTLQNRTGDEKAAEQSLEAASWAAEAGRDDELKAKISIELLFLLGYRKGRLAEAQQFGRRAAATVERLDQPPLLAAHLEYHLGSLALREGKHAEAEEHLKRSLEIREARLGPEHADVANTLTSLAAVAREQGAYGQSFTYSSRALAILEKAVGLDHPVVADALTAMANALKHEGKPQEALPAYERALAIREKAIGPESPAVAAALSNLGTDLRALGRYAEAIEISKRALAIEEKTIGADHIEVARTLGNLGNLAKLVGDRETAIDYTRRALAIFEKALRPDHPDVSLAQSNLASFYADLGQYQAALDLDGRALAAREKALGREHPLVATTLGNMAVIFDAQKKWSKAAAYHARALAIREKSLGPNHPMVARTLVTYARSLVLGGKPQAAIPMAERALAIPDPTKNKGDSFGPAAAEAILARALWDARRDRKRAIELGQHAYKAFRDAGELTSQPYLELEEWLRPKLKAQPAHASTQM